MALPVIAAGVIGQAIVQVITKPWPWMFLLGWIAVSKFDFGIFADEVRATLWSLWPFVLLLIFGFFVVKIIAVVVNKKTSDAKD